MFAQLVITVFLIWVVAEVLCRTLLAQPVAGVLRDLLRVAEKTETSPQVAPAAPETSVLLGGKIFSTVEKGTYQVKQAAITGTMIMGGGGDTDTQTTDFAQMMQLLVAKEMGLDLSIPSGR